MEAYVNFVPQTKTIRKIKLFETKEFFLLLGTDKCGQECNVLKIKKITDYDKHFRLSTLIAEEPKTFVENEIDHYFQKVTANLQTVVKVKQAWGLLGFVKFLKGYYIVLVTEKKKVCKIGRHSIYKVKDMKMVPLFQSMSSTGKEDEDRYVQTFKDIQISEGFYFSYTYDITHRLQNNTLKQIKTQEPPPASGAQEDNLFTSYVQQERRSNRLASNLEEGSHYQNSKSFKMTRTNALTPFDEKFVWNHYLLKEFYEMIENKKWILPIIHGFVSSISNSILDLIPVDLHNERNYVTFILISRRSRHFAGTRYLKRGVNEEGKVANFVETEQIVYYQNHTYDDKPVFSSYVQIRGSIPLFWTQKANALVAKPDIILLKTDSQYRATKRHIQEIFKNYSFPLIILNLTKEFNNRESKVAEEYRHVINKVVNPYLQKPLKVKYVHYDVKNRKKQEKDTFPASLFEMIKEFVKNVKVFTCRRKNMSEELCSLKMQRGVVRTNCIDSLDRTNMAQELQGYYVFMKQLKSLGIIKKKDLDMKTQIYSEIIAIFNKMGDTISLQYGSSIAHHSSLNKKKNIFKSALPEIITSVKRHMANNFSDPVKQGIFNLFLGIYQPATNPQPMWNLSNDANLHRINEENLPKLHERWWEQALRKYSYDQQCRYDITLPTEMQLNLTSVFTKVYDQSDDEEDSKNARSKKPSWVSLDSLSPMAGKAGQGDRTFSEKKEAGDKLVETPRRKKRLTDKLAQTPPSPFSNNALSLVKMRSEEDKEGEEKTRTELTRGRFKNHFIQFDDLDKFEKDDDDPFYELYNGNKLTFIEKKLKNHFSKVEQIQFSNETLEDEIKLKIPAQQKQKSTGDKAAIKGEKEYTKLMKGLVEMGKIINENEKRRYKNYLNQNQRLLEYGVLNYTQSLYSRDVPSLAKGVPLPFTPEEGAALHSSSFFRNVSRGEISGPSNQMMNAVNTLKGDLQVFENYSHFGMHSLDSLKIKEKMEKRHTHHIYLQLDSQYQITMEQPSGVDTFDFNEQEVNQDLLAKYRDKILKLTGGVHAVDDDYNFRQYLTHREQPSRTEYVKAKHVSTRPITLSHQQSEIIQPSSQRERGVHQSQNISFTYIGKNNKVYPELGGSVLLLDPIEEEMQVNKERKKKKKMRMTTKEEKIMDSYFDDFFGK